MRMIARSTLGFHYHITLFPLLLLVVLLLPSSNVVQGGTARYRQGRFVILSSERDEESESLLFIRQSISVSQARKICALDQNCVSFGFLSAETRFPLATTVYFYKHAVDWRLIPNVSIFQEDPAWHLWVNTTREIASIPTEVKRVIKLLDSLDCSTGTAGGDGAAKPPPEKETQAPPANSRSLRSAGGAAAASSSSTNSENDNLQQNQQQQQPPIQTLKQRQECIAKKAQLLDGIFHLVYPKQLKNIATPLLIPKMMELSALAKSEDELIRKGAATNLIVMADSKTTPPLLVQAGVYEAMKLIIEQEAPKSGSAAASSFDWQGMPILALDAISNIAMYRTANTLLQQKGAPAFLKKIMETTTGFPALQSTLALLHLDAERELITLPKATVQELVQLLQNAIDGDVQYGIVWDLIPGPLSAIQLLVQQRITNDSTIATLLEAGLIEELLRILEPDTTTTSSAPISAQGLVAAHVEATLEILQGLALVSEEAREMIYLAGHSLSLLQQQLEEYQPPAHLAKQLVASVAKPNFVNWADEL